MADKYVSVTVEYGYIVTEDDGTSAVFDDHSEVFDSSDPVASFGDLFDDLAFEARNTLE